MTIPLYGSSSALFNRLGRIGKVAYLSSGCQSNIVTTLTSLVGGYTGTDEFLTGQLTINRDSLTRGVASGLLGTLTNLATSTLTEMVRQDQPARVSNPVGELIRQMLASADSVQKCTVAASSTADGSNTGDNVLFMTTVRGDGLTLENIIAESGRLVITQDSRTGGATAGAEQWLFTGTGNTAGVWDWDYPQGSAASTQGSSVDALTGTNSALNNGSFNTWTGTAPNNWTATGTFVKETSLTFDGSGNAFRVAAAQTAALKQQFASSTQNSTILNPLSSLCFGMRIRGSVSLTGGTLTVSLVDGTGTTLNDAQGNPQSVAFALNGTGTAWTAKTGVVRLPKVMPTTGYFFQISVTTPAGGDVIIDHLAAAAPVALYTGGPGVVMFGGATPANVGDGWTTTTTNNRGGASENLTWQAVFGRLFGPANLLPSSSTPTVADTLISS